MDIINVIETDNGIFVKITSFPILYKEHEDQQARNAEQKFLECVKAQGSDETDEDILDMDNWQDNNGYEVSIIWSHEIKSL